MGVQSNAHSVQAKQPVRLAYRRVRPTYSLILGFTSIGPRFGPIFGLLSFWALVGHQESVIGLRICLGLGEGPFEELGPI